MATNLAFLALTLLSGLTSAAQVTGNATSNSSLPIVNLGYELQQATSYNSSGAFYSFKNIRYGAPPVGALRWNYPQSPATNLSVVQTGEQDRSCSQASAAWLATAGPFVVDYLGGQTEFNSSSFPAANISETATIGATETEDCLFLDVAVPEGIFNSRDEQYGAPVLVWIHGGGYAIGSKNSAGSPAGLLASSQANGERGVVFVAINYRLGTFGFLSGSGVQANGTVNAGLFDQRLALEWVQQNIHLFGGDPEKVTVFGESAGGGSIMAHIASFGGSRGPAPFAQALLQSPAFPPLVSPQELEGLATDFYSTLNVSTVEEARLLSYADLYQANYERLGASYWGTFAYSPTIDGEFLPDLPGRLLARGLFDKNVRVMTAHNSDEGLLFTSPYQQNETAFEGLITSLVPGVKAYPEVLDYITGTLYPAIYNDSSKTNYTDPIGRASLLTAEYTFTCNTHYVNKAFKNNTRSYQFASNYGLHSADVPYSFYTGVGQQQPSTLSTDFGGVINPKTAIVLQGYITQFALTGTPNGNGLPYLPLYGSNATQMLLNETAAGLVSDPSANSRCDWWQKGLWY